MKFLLLSKEMSKSEVKYLKIISILFTMFCLIGCTSRYLRKQGYQFFSNDIIVGIEHILAGFGIPALFIIIMLLISFLIYKRHNIQNIFDQFFNSILFRFIFFIIAIFFTIDLSYSHEIKQAFEHVYHGKPRGYVQYWQIYCDQLGVLSFSIFTIHFYCKNIFNKISKVVNFDIKQ